MRTRLTVFFFGLAIGYRAGNFAAYWYLRTWARREQAEAIRAAGRQLRAAAAAERARRAA